MKWTRCILLGSLLSLSVTVDGQETTKPPMLIGPDQLLKKLSDAKLRVVDARSKNDFSKGHIPGAVRVDVGSWKTLATANHGLHNVKAWSSKVGALGIKKDTQVVVYGSSLASTARIWWLLKYVGVKNAGILNGSFRHWVQAGGPTQTAAAKIAATKFEPRFQSDRLAEIDFLKKSLKSKKIKVVDTRSDREFAGGRIPGSAHLDWQDLLAKDGRLKSTKQLKELFQKRGISPSETAVCY